MNHDGRSDCRQPNDTGRFSAPMTGLLRQRRTGLLREGMTGLLREGMTGLLRERMMGLLREPRPTELSHSGEEGRCGVDTPMSRSVATRERGSIPPAGQS